MDEVRRTLEETYAHSDFRPEAGAVWDLTGVTIDLPTEEVRHLADFVGKLAGDRAPGRAALLVSGELDEGLIKMYESILSGQSSKPIMIFRDKEEAERWLLQKD
jgi:O-methyltransferase involved in polyketide biosynthesis